MSKIKKRTKSSKLIILLITIACILGIGYYYSSFSKNIEEWIKDRDTPIVAHMNKGADLFTQKQYSTAEREFQQAYKLAKTADTESSTLWKERMEKISPPRKFYTGDPANRSSSGLLYFKNRMVEAIYGYASSVYWQITDKYANQTIKAAQEQDPLYKIPEKEFAPALDSLDTGIKIDPKSESLRILKAEILKDCGKYTEAIDLLTEVVTFINSRSADAYNLLGLIYSMPFYMQSPNYKEYQKKALGMFEKASILPSSTGNRLAAPNYNLGLYYTTPPLGKSPNALPSPADARKAINYFEEYLKIAGDNAEYSDKAKAEIDRLSRIAP